MGKRVISFGISEKEIDRAIREVEQFKKDFQTKCDLVLEKIANRLVDEMQKGFNGAIVDDLTEDSGGAREAKVLCRKEKRDNGYVVVADGKDAVWVEFGAGVHHNGSVGQSPNPYGQALNFTIGGFGVNGKKDLWGFYEGEELRLTHGTPAKMPMYNAVQTVSKEVVEIAREVFQ